MFAKITLISYLCAVRLIQGAEQFTKHRDVSILVLVVVVGIEGVYHNKFVGVGYQGVAQKK